MENAIFKIRNIIIHNNETLKILKKTIPGILNYLSFIFGGIILSYIIIAALMYGKNENWENDVISLSKFIFQGGFLFFTSLFFLLKKRI